VRESNTAKICKGHFYRIPLNGDRDFILALMDALSGKMPKYDAKRILELSGFMKKAEFGVIFAGIGLTYSIKDDIDILVSLADMLPNFHVMPMVGHYNMRGFNEALFKETGFVNRVKFENKPVHDNKYAIVEALKAKSIDALLVAGSDPISNLPRSVLPHLTSIPVICIDPCVTLTSKIAAVTIPAAASGLECGGSAVRMDGKVIEISKVVENSYLTDAQILTRLMEGL
jgi:formylmethanofuran dehydrogenase subunit B